ncbi:cupin domain-containing protein [Mucilaginibacter limnophilus]|uniref:cupin domain-containing protein n=1 Tax=Mucilaginibacter limnophilus TaxID=1932778 RepID=UPI00197C44BF|nr:cupin domain-containing protein [Mucilaginibacter limnophilus]
MACKGKLLINPVTGQNIKFIQTTKDTSGQLLEMESTFKAGSQQPIEHYHPYQHEDFKVLEGELQVKIGSERRTLRSGDSLHIPANQPHAMWNVSTAKAVVNWQVRPAMDTE